MKSVWKKALVPAVLAVTVLAPVTAFAADGSSAAPNGKTAKKAISAIEQKFDTVKSQFTHRVNKEHRLLAQSVGPHHEMYMELLAEKYTPDALDDWKAAFAAREQALAELKTKLPQLKQQATGAAKQLKTQVQALREQAKSGQITKEQFKQQLQALLQASKAQLQADLSAKQADPTARRALQAEFKKAVSDQSAAEIQAVMPKLLAQYQQDTQTLLEKIGQLPAAPTTTTPQTAPSGSQA